MKNVSVFILIIVILGLSIKTMNSSMKKTAPTTSKQSAITNAAITTREGSYKITAGDAVYYDNVKGYFATPSEDGQYPGVVMIHEWWGLNDNIRTMAKRLASFGYNVLAVDLFNGEVAVSPDEATKLVNSLNNDAAIQNLKEAAAYLRNHKSTKVASLGWCFGGGQSLQLALNDSLDATVIYYGNLVTDEPSLASIQWPVLGIFGDKDQTIPVQTVKDFQKSLNDLKVDNEIYIYKGVGHAFANPTGPNYAPGETKDAWNKTVAFLDKHLKQSK